MTFSPPNPSVNLLDHYVSQSEASEDYGVPPRMIEYWIAKRRVRIAEFKKDGEGKRSIYVNKFDVGILKDIYDENMDILCKSGEGLTYEEALHDYPRLNSTLLEYLVNGCYIESYQTDKQDVKSTWLRRSNLDEIVEKLKEVDTLYQGVLARNQFLLKKDVNSMIRSMIYLSLFFKVTRQYRFHPVETVNMRFLTVIVNRDTRLEYREGYNMVDIILSGEANGVLNKERGL